MILAKEYLNTACQICATNNVMIGSGRITEVEDNHIIIKSATEEFPVLNFLSYVKVTVNHPSAGYKVILATVTESDVKSMRLSSLFLLTGSEKRGYFRVHISMATRLFYRDAATTKTLGDASSDVADSSIPSVSVVIKDLSLSGVLFECTQFLQVGQVAVVEIELAKKAEPFLISVKRRINDPYANEKLYQYGCIFNEKNPKKMDELCRLILKLQAQIIHKTKDNQ